MLGEIVVFVVGSDVGVASNVASNVCEVVIFVSITSVVMISSSVVDKLTVVNIGIVVINGYIVFEYSSEQVDV